MFVWVLVFADTHWLCMWGPKIDMKSHPPLLSLCLSNCDAVFQLDPRVGDVHLVFPWGRCVILLRLELMGGGGGGCCIPQTRLLVLGIQAQSSGSQSKFFDHWVTYSVPKLLQAILMGGNGWIEYLYALNTVKYTIKIFLAGHDGTWPLIPALER